MRSAKIPSDVWHDPFAVAAATAASSTRGTQHLNFGEDSNDTLWFSTNSQGKRAVVGWLNTKKFWAKVMPPARKAGQR